MPAPKRSDRRAGAPDLPRISYVIGRLDRAVSLEIERSVAEHGLTLPQYTALSILRRRGGLSNAQLARRTYVRPQSVNEVVTALERGGLIVRAPDENHRRILRTELTDKGSKVLAACDRSVTRMEDTMLEGLSERQRDELLRGLLSCVQQLGAGFPEL